MDANVSCFITLKMCNIMEKMQLIPDCNHTAALGFSAVKLHILTLYNLFLLSEFFVCNNQYV